MEEHAREEEGTVTTTHQVLLLHSRKPKTQKNSLGSRSPCLLLYVCQGLMSGELRRTVRLWQRLCGQKRREELVRSEDGRHPELSPCLSSFTPNNPERPMGNYHPLPDYRLGSEDPQGGARKRYSCWKGPRPSVHARPKDHSDLGETTAEAHTASHHGQTSDQAGLETH